MLPLPADGVAHLMSLAVDAALIGGPAAVQRASRGDAAAARVNLRGLLLPFGAAAGICALAVLVSPVVALARAKCRAIELYALAGSWHLGWAVAAACAVRAIRDPRAPVLAAICALTVIVITLAFRGAG